MRVPSRRVWRQAASNAPASFVVVAPKLETEHEIDVSVSGDEEWSDSDLAPQVPGHCPHFDSLRSPTRSVRSRVFLFPFFFVSFRFVVVAAAAVRFRIGSTTHSGFTPHC